MESRELISTANELLSAHQFHKTDCRFKNLANYVLATVSKDDDEPLTEEWAEKNSRSIIELIDSINNLDTSAINTRGKLRRLISSLKGD